VLKIRTIAGAVWLEILRKKDLYVLLILLSALLITLVSLNIFGLGGMSRYVKDIGLLLAWIFGLVLTIHISARELPQEETRGTIFPLLARPITHAEIIIGKWLGVWSIVVMATLCFYLLVAGVTIGMGGSIGLAAITQGFMLHAVLLGIISAIALAFSTRLNSDAAATMSFVIAGASFLIIPRIPNLLVHQQGLSSNVLLLLYNILPHFEIFDMRKRIVHDYGPMPNNICALIILYGITLIAIILFIAFLLYRKKRFSRGAIQG
jgi:ABC-type transport system involved in multi-copper enzyme maturation permease subunit